ncbi:hypothetical protein M405DRAFT_847352 [Rhizopogon salebrosus TDB-379]|nr:hypothetical protein M405DRAFT_847352 [Rhizopogon salebrosus TDB-379]
MCEGGVQQSGGESTKFAGRLCVLRDFVAIKSLVVERWEHEAPRPTLRASYRFLIASMLARLHAAARLLLGDDCTWSLVLVGARRLMERVALSGQKCTGEPTTTCFAAGGTANFTQMSTPQFVDSGIQVSKPLRSLGLFVSLTGTTNGMFAVLIFDSCITRQKCVFSYTEFFNDCRKVALGLEPEMDVRAIYIHDIAVLWTAALRTQYYPGESLVVLCIIAAEGLLIIRIYAAWNIGLSLFTTKI